MEKEASSHLLTSEEGDLCSNLSICIEDQSGCSNELQQLNAKENEFLHEQKDKIDQLEEEAEELRTEIGAINVNIENEKSLYAKAFRARFVTGLIPCIGTVATPIAKRYENKSNGKMKAMTERRTELEQRVIHLQNERFSLQLKALFKQKNQQLNKQDKKLIETIEDLFMSRDNHNETKKEFQMTRKELQRTRVNLQITSEKLQTTSKELQMTRKELRDTKEDLRTSKKTHEITKKELKSTTEDLKKKKEELRKILEVAKPLLRKKIVRLIFIHLLMSIVCSQSNSMYCK